MQGAPLPGAAPVSSTGDCKLDVLLGGFLPAVLIIERERGVCEPKIAPYDAGPFVSRLILLLFRAEQVLGGNCIRLLLAQLSPPFDEQPSPNSS